MVWEFSVEDDQKYTNSDHWNMIVCNTYSINQKVEILWFLQFACGMLGAGAPCVSWREKRQKGKRVEEEGELPTNPRAHSWWENLNHALKSSNCYLEILLLHSHHTPARRSHKNLVHLRFRKTMWLATYWVWINVCIKIFACTAEVVPMSAPFAESPFSACCMLSSMPATNSPLFLLLEVLDRRRSIDNLSAMDKCETHSGRESVQ